MTKTWVVGGLLNTVEHGAMRVFDIATSLLLISFLSADGFAAIAVAQAWVAPLLLFFLSPDAALYRHFAEWRVEGREAFGARLRAFRLFAWGKGAAGILLALVLASFLPLPGGYADRFWALVWGFSLVLAIQVAGPDREFLRLSMRLRSLIVLTVTQKLVLLGGAAFAMTVWPGSLAALALAAVASMGIGAGSSGLVARRILKELPSSRTPSNGVPIPGAVETLRHAILDFSLWLHLTGVIQNWAQTIELFFLGLFRVPAYSVGLFAVTVRMANASVAVPLALGNVFSIWVGRRRAAEGLARETRLLGFGTLGLVGAVLVQGAILYAAAPWLLELLSRGRWTAQEQALMTGWFRVLLLGVAIFASTLLVVAWLALRRSVLRLLLAVYIPWGLGAAALTAALLQFDGLDALPWARVASSALFAVLVVAFLAWTGRRRAGTGVPTNEPGCPRMSRDARE